MSVELDGATVQLDKCSCSIKPVFGGGALKGLDISVEASAALTERSNSADTAELNTALAQEIKSWVSYVIEKSLSTGCDFLQLGSSLEMQEPRSLRGMTEDFGSVMPYIYYNISVQAEISRSYDLDLPEGGK